MTPRKQKPARRSGRKALVKRFRGGGVFELSDTQPTHRWLFPREEGLCINGIDPLIIPWDVVEASLAARPKRKPRKGAK